MNVLARDFTPAQPVSLEPQRARVSGRWMATVFWRATASGASKWRSAQRRRLLNIGEACGLNREELRALLLEPKPDARARLPMRAGRLVTHGEVAEIVFRECFKPRVTIAPFIIEALAAPQGLKAARIIHLIDRAHEARLLKPSSRKRFLALVMDETPTPLAPKAKAHAALLARIAAEAGVSLSMMMAVGWNQSRTARLVRARWTAVLALYSMETANHISGPTGPRYRKHGVAWVARVLGVDHTTAFHAISRMGLNRCCGCDRNRHGYGDVSAPPVSLRAAFDHLNRKA